MQFNNDSFFKIYDSIKLSILRDKSNHLDHQYHYGCMYLCASILKVDTTHWEKKIISQIPFLEKWGTSSFVKESLNLSRQHTGVDSSFLLNKFNDKSVQKKYHALDYLYLDYFNNNDWEGVIREIKYCNNSGILFDTYIGEDRSKDLVYHCRNLEILLNLNVTKSEEGKYILSKSASLIMDLLRLGTFSLFFGRSANSSYGMSSLYLVLSVLRFDTDEKEQERVHYLRLIEEKLVDMVSKSRGFDLNLSRGRAGSDSYMYPPVYSAFALSRILLAKFGRYERHTISYIKSELSGYFEVVKLCDGIDIIYNGVLGNKSAIFPSDFRYKSGIALAYLKNGKEHALLPYLTLEFSPMDGYIRKQISLRANGIFARLFDILNAYNILNRIETFSISSLSCSINDRELRGGLLPRKLKLALVPSDLKEVLLVGSLHLFSLSLPTATGKERFQVVLYR